MSLRFTALFLALVTLTGCSVFQSSVTGSATLDDFAKCLASKSTFYGSNLCRHCQNEKSRFGDSFQYVKYVECTTQPEECEKAGVDAYPYWVINGAVSKGDMELKKLSELSGCTLPAGVEEKE